MTANPIKTAVKDCASGVAMSLVSLIVVASAVGWTAEHWQLITQVVSKFASNAWAGMLYMMSFGGNFWPSVAVGVSMISVVAWVLCVGNKLPNAEYEKVEKLLFSIGILAAMMWLVSFFAMHSTFGAMSELSAYCVIAVVVMTIPFIGVALCALFAFFELVAILER